MAYATGTANHRPSGANPVEKISEANSVANKLFAFTIRGLQSNDRH